MSRIPHWGIAVAPLLAVLLLAWPAAAQTKGAIPTDPALVEKIQKSNAECIACHTEGALKAPPRADMDLEKLRDALVDPALFATSNHAGMECKVCHGQGYAAFPHDTGAKALISTCGECHAQKSMRIETQYEKSIHAQHLKDKFTCQTCHDPHVYKVAAKLGDPRRIVSQDNAMCLDCHNSDLRFASFGMTLTPVKRRPDIDTIHAWLPNTRLHWQAVRCVECHTPVSPTKSLGLSHEIVGKDKAEKNCVACHTRQTALSTRLYRHLAEQETEQLGFVNSVMLRSAYIVGATRNVHLDTAALWLFGLTVAGLGAHGVIRLVLTVIRRRRAS